MRALVAPDKFKGSLSAAEVADNLARGLAATGVHTVTLPLADGGDGSVAAAVSAGMRPHPCTSPTRWVGRIPPRSLSTPKPPSWKWPIPAD